jgi:hypothetical protein
MTDAALEASPTPWHDLCIRCPGAFTCLSLSMSRHLHAAVHWATMYVHNLMHAGSTTATLRAPTPTTPTTDVCYLSLL